MKKKISISTLAFLFFASTTGLPLVLHYCEMMQSFSLEVCEMHNNETIVTSCCEAENTSQVYFSKGYDTCCTTKLVDSSVKDDFVLNKTEFTKIQLLLVLNSDLIYNFSNQSSNNFYNDTSPPLLADNHLYLNNSILLI
jgi:hypothetical protein